MIGVAEPRPARLPAALTPPAASSPPSTPGAARSSTPSTGRSPGGVQRVSRPPGRLARRPRRPSSWPPARRCCSSATAPSATARCFERPAAGRAGRPRARPTRRPRSLVQLAHAQALREEFVKPVGARRRCTCASPTPRSTGRPGTGVSVADGRAASPEPDELDVTIGPMRRRHLRSVLRIEAAGVPAAVVARACS